ncbi:MAG TPA: hypothetical protein VFQ05_00315, partial [Candidatus Eisenbacteria bacterium]|nr:hypothetical protein [Candidatus Eisenbacteria bacterium]
PASRRHATLRATLEWSVDALGPAARRAFCSLSVFASGWDLPAAAAVLDLDEIEALDAIDGLVHRSLVVAESRGEEARYRYLEPVRQLALQNLLTCEDEASGAVRRMVQHFVGLAQQAGPALIGPEQTRWLDRIELEHENLMAAVEDCASLPAGAESALRITGSLWRFWNVRGRLRTGLETVRRALAMPGAESAGLARAGALYAAAALIASDTGGQRGADEFFEQALVIYRAHEDELGMARCLSGLGAVTSARRDFAAGAKHLHEAQGLFRRLGDRRGLAATLNNLGAAAWNQGDLDSAGRAVGEALDLSRESGDLNNVAQLSVTMAFIDTRLRRADSARRHLRECLSTLGALGARHSSAGGALLASAELATLEGRFADCVRWLGAADLVLERIGLVFDEQDVWWKERERCRKECGVHLGEEAAEREYQAGRAIEAEQALSLALASLDAAEAPATL